MKKFDIFKRFPSLKSPKHVLNMLLVVLFAIVFTGVLVSKYVFFQTIVGSDNNSKVTIVAPKNIEVIDGNLDDILVSFDYHLKMKEKGILLNNIEKSDDENGIIKLYSSNKHSLKEINEKKIIITSIDRDVENFELPDHQTKIYKNIFTD